MAKTTLRTELAVTLFSLVMISCTNTAPNNPPEKNNDFSVKSQENFNQIAANKANAKALQKANEHSALKLPPKPGLILTIGATASSYSGYYSLWGSCTDGGGIIHLSFTQGGGSGYTDVACVAGKWIYNEAYLGEVSVWNAKQGSLTATYTLDGSNLYSDSSGMPVCEQPYTWVHEMTDVFGTLECHPVGYCANGNPYVYADWIADDCK